MSGSKAISEIYKEHKKSFLKHLKAAKSLEEERIHKLRIEIKRLRSLFKFLEFFSKNKFHRKKVMQLISPVFKSAGEIRATSLNIKLTGAYKSVAVAGFKQHLELKSEDDRKRFLETVKNFDKENFKELSKEPLHFFKKADPDSVGKCSKKYVKDLFSKIRDEMTDGIPDEHFHEVRKKLKDVKTITALLEEVAPGKTSHAQQQKVNMVEEKIGKWHDTVTLVEGLETFTKNNKKDKDSKKLSTMILNLKSHSEASKKLISEQLKVELL